MDLFTLFNGGGSREQIAVLMFGIRALGAWGLRGGERIMKNEKLIVNNGGGYLISPRCPLLIVN
jgi:hypothetical protein